MSTQFNPITGVTPDLRSEESKPAYTPGYQDPNELLPFRHPRQEKLQDLQHKLDKQSILNCLDKELESLDVQYQVMRYFYIFYCWPFTLLFLVLVKYEYHFEFDVN